MSVYCPAWDWDPFNQTRLGTMDGQGEKMKDLFCPRKPSIPTALDKGTKRIRFARPLLQDSSQFSSSESSTIDSTSDKESASFHPRRKLAPPTSNGPNAVSMQKPLAAPRPHRAQSLDSTDSNAAVHPSDNKLSIRFMTMDANNVPRISSSRSTSPAVPPVDKQLHRRQQNRKAYGVPLH
jgi:hypothetical protein